MVSIDRTVLRDLVGMAALYLDARDGSHFLIGCILMDQVVPLEEQNASFDAAHRVLEQTMSDTQKELVG